jgi:transcription initiation factor TFIIIB Brf1 subunit/transcription initiation factor TFIIB
MAETIEAYVYEEPEFDESDFSDSDSSDEECSHTQTSNIDGSTVCMICGLKVDEALLDNETRYYGAADTRYTKDPSRHNQRKNEERSLYSDLEPLGFPQEIIERANTYYKEIIKDKIYRAGNRMSIVFACTYHAYADMQEPRVPMELAAKFKLDKKGISNGLKTFSHVFRKRPGKKYIDAMDLVPKLLSELHIEKSRHKTCKDDIQTIYDFVQSKSRTFNSSNPQSIAAGLVYYYLKLNDVPITRSEFSKVVHLTDITFTKIATDTHKVLGNQTEIKF